MQQFKAVCDLAKEVCDYVDQQEMESVELLLSHHSSYRWVKIEFRAGATSEQAHAIRRIFGIGKMKKTFNDPDKKQDWQPDLEWDGSKDSLRLEMCFYKICRITGTETKEVPIYECTLPE